MPAHPTTANRRTVRDQQPTSERCLPLDRDDAFFARTGLAQPGNFARPLAPPEFGDRAIGSETAAQKSPALDNLRRKRDAELKDAAETVRTLLIRLGLTGLTDLVINFDPWGDVVVSGNLPTMDRVRLGKTLSTHAGFRSAFAAAAHTAALVAASEVLVPFARAYEGDANQAVAHYAWLFDSGWAFSLIYAKGQATFRVTSGL
jgi:hypothetical protein